VKRCHGCSENSGMRGVMFWTVAFEDMSLNVGEWNGTKGLRRYEGVAAEGSETPGRCSGEKVSHFLGRRRGNKLCNP